MYAFESQTMQDFRRMYLSFALQPTAELLDLRFAVLIVGYIGGGILTVDSGGERRRGNGDDDGGREKLHVVLSNGEKIYVRSSLLCEDAFDQSP